jgi:iron complex outermembrane receptor protein
VTLDYYNVRKTDVIVSGPLGGAARAAYYTKTNVADACAAVAAIGQGYSCNLIDAVDPLFPNALPRILIVNTPFVNAGSLSTQGIDLAMTAIIPLGDDMRFVSRLDVTDILRAELDPGDGSTIQHYEGTMGPYELSSGAGTPKWRGSWQNKFVMGDFSITATTTYVGHIKNVAEDEEPGLGCDKNLYGTGDKFCYIKSFVNVDLHTAWDASDRAQFYIEVADLFDAKAPWRRARTRASITCRPGT